MLRNLGIHIPRGEGECPQIGDGCWQVDGEHCQIYVYIELY